jgi:hypothetical protein
VNAYSSIDEWSISSKICRHLQSMKKAIFDLYALCARSMRDVQLHAVERFLADPVLGQEARFNSANVVLPHQNSNVIKEQHTTQQNDQHGLGEDF